MASLDDILESGGATIVPGVYDALSARVAAQSGAKLLYMTGFGVAGAGFGVPDIGLVSAAEMIERVGVIAAAAAPIPMIADGDNGHGGPLNVARLTRAYERAGAAAIQIEDQVFPKRCGHMEDKDVVSRTEATQKIRAAADARSNRSFKIIARTDARATHNLDEALARGEGFLKAGADILFIEAPRSVDELHRIAQTFGGTPLVANIVEDGKTPLLTPKEFAALGFRILLYPISALLVVTRRLEKVYEYLLRGERQALDEERASFNHYNEIMNLQELMAVTRALSQTNNEE